MAHQEPVTPKERRELTKDRAKPVKPHALPTTESKPATAAQIALLKQNERNLKTAGPKSAAVPARSGSGVSQASFMSGAAAGADAVSYSSGALYQVSTDPFRNAAAQQGGWLMALGNHIGAAVPGEPVQVSAAIWQSGGADTEVHPVKVRWQVDYYNCRLNHDDVQYFDFGQTVQAPTLNTDKVFPEVKASFTVPTTQCTTDFPSLVIWACTTVTDDPTDTESCGSYNMFYIVPALPDGAACAAVCGDASGAAGTTVMRADPVNTATGAFTEAFTDAQVPAPGVPLTVSRVYSSDNPLTGALGKGWQLPWETRLQIQSSGDAVLVGEGGSRHTYTKKSDGTFTTPGQARSKLAGDGSGYKLTTAAHATYVDPRGNVSGADPTKYTTSYTYDAADRVKTVTDARGNTTVLDYDEVGNLRTVTDAAKRVTKYDYDDADRLVTIADPALKQTVLDYDPAGRLKKETNRRGATVTYDYDKAGNQVQVVTARGNATGADPKPYTWVIGYDKVGNRKTVTDPLKKTTAFTWDADNRPLSVTDPLNHTRSVKYDDNGSVLTTTDGLGHGMTLTYDENNRLKTSKTWAGYLTSYEYDDDGHLSAEVSPESERTTART